MANYPEIPKFIKFTDQEITEFYRISNKNRDITFYILESEKNTTLGLL